MIKTKSVDKVAGEPVPRITNDPASCNKMSCQLCKHSTKREHGPYWYRQISGEKKVYIGRELPAEYAEILARDMQKNPDKHPHAVIFDAETLTGKEPDEVYPGKYSAAMIERNAMHRRRRDNERAAEDDQLRLI